MAHHDAIRTIAQRHPEFWIADNVRLNNEDFRLFLNTWNQLKSDFGLIEVSYLVWKQHTHSPSGLQWFASIQSSRSDARVPVGWTKSGEHDAIFQYNESPFLRPYLRRMNREILRQRLQTMLGGLVSQGSVLSRARRHRLCDPNVLISVLPMYLQPGPVSGS